MKRRLTALSTTIILGIGSSISFLPAVQAEQTSLNSVQEQRTGIQSEITKTGQEISQVQEEMAKISEQIIRAG
jgi:peptidoglycan hydrolase CwlO-like protein